uniref:Molybdate-anion transporter n=1 Tax=Haptolina brevifila TaxID=156173 RepID=A0A7S2BU15_9EUKA
MAGLLAALLAYEEQAKRKNKVSVETPLLTPECNSQNLQSIYLPVYLLSVCADWLQGPYVYALYASLGYGRTSINVLFVIGFGTAGLLGPFIGHLADRFGRKQMILTMYCGGYALACVTKHFQLFSMLALGRFLGGAATSVLFSCFEAWLVAEHQRRKRPATELQALLSRQYFLNGLAGCAMGVLAQMVVDSVPLHQVDVQYAGPFAGVLYWGGETLSFDLSFLCLAIAALFICCLWSENIWVGAKPSGIDSDQWRIVEALRCLWNDGLLLAIMLVSAMTESAMYAFVIEWTPVLTVNGVGPPHGLVFSCFMIAYMAGSTLFGLFAERFSAAKLLVAYSTLSFFALLSTFLLLYTGMAETPNGVFATFLLLTSFELGLGGYMAAIATLKAAYVPSSLRATIYNIFRVPLNAIVVVLNVISLSSEFTFLSCTCLQAVALAGSIAITSRLNSDTELV